MTHIWTRRAYARLETTIPTTIAVLGAGAWGTALAIAFARQGAAVRLWSRRPAHAETMRAERQNGEHLSGFRFPDAIEATASLEHAVSGAHLVVLAAPSSATSELAAAAAEHVDANAHAVICAKGLGEGGELLSTSVRRRWPGGVFVLAGPSFADEVAADLPTIVALAGPRPHAQDIAARLSSESFVLCPTQDLIGVQVAAVFKNVAATLCGVSDGLGLGSNARAALMSEAMRETGDLVSALDGQRETLLGPAGFGDFALTCTDAKSRNYSFGRLLGQGGGPGGAEVTREGAANVDALRALARRTGVRAPLAEAVSDLLRGRVGTREAVEAAFSGRRSRVAAESLAA